MTTATLKYGALQNYIGGSFVPDAARSLDVLSPLNGEVISTVPLSSATTLDAAVMAAKAAFGAWSSMPV